MRCNDLSANAPRFISCAGSPEKPVYHTKITGDGLIELECTGYEDIQAKIEAERPGCELSVLIARYENGDLLALNSRPGFYDDATKFPANMIDAMNIVSNAEIEFSKLPVDVKKEFDSDWRKWLAQFGSDNWNNVMEKVFVSSKDDVKESEKNVDE